MRQTFVLWLICILFVAAVIANVIRNPLDSDNTQIDEQAHLSYAFTLISQDRWWPDFDHFPMVDSSKLAPLKLVNYLNHPPTFYWLAKLMRSVMPSLDGVQLRYVSLILIITAMAWYARIGVRLSLPLGSTILYAMLPFLIFMHLQVGFYNNDAAAILGGMIVVDASLSWFRGERVTRAFWLTLLGLTLASVKLTAFMLVTLYVLCCITLKHRQLRALKARHWLAAMVIGAVLLTPYALLFRQTGSLAPETAGQQLFMKHTPAEGWSRIPIDGWVQQERMDFWPWLETFLRNFANQVERFDTTFIPLVFFSIGFGIVVCRKPISPNQQMMLACCATSAMMLAVHIAFSWPRYYRYGWLLDSGLRYYFPLLGAYGMVCAEGLQRLTRVKGTSS